MESSVLRGSLGARGFRESSFATLALAAVFTADYAIDHVSGQLNQHAYRRYTKHKEIVVDSETLLFIAGTVVVPLIALLPTSPEAGLPLALIYTCTSQAQLILLGGFVGIMCTRYYRAHFPLLAVAFGIACFSGASMLMPSAINIAAGPVTPFRNVLFYLHYPGGLVFLLCALRWMYRDIVVAHVAPCVRRLVTLRLRLGGHYDVSKYVTAHDLRKQHAEGTQYFPMSYALSAILWYD